MYDRIDMYVVHPSAGGGVRVFKHFEHRKPNQGASDISIVEDWTLDEMSAWLEVAGWKVRRWPGGARAWKHEITPIRPRHRIRKMRNDLASGWGDPEVLKVLHTLDLAFDL